MTDIADELAEYAEHLGFPLLQQPRGNGLCPVRPIGPARQKHEEQLRRKAQPHKPHRLDIDRT